MRYFSLVPFFFALQKKKNKRNRRNKIIRNKTQTIKCKAVSECLLPQLFHPFLCRTLPAPCRFLSAEQNTVDLIKASLAIRTCFLQIVKIEQTQLPSPQAIMLLFSKQKQIFTKCVLFSGWQGECTPHLKLGSLIQVRVQPLREHCSGVQQPLQGGKSISQLLFGYLRHPRTWLVFKKQICILVSTGVSFFSAHLVTVDYVKLSVIWHCGFK